MKQRNITQIIISLSGSQTHLLLQVHVTNLTNIFTFMWLKNHQCSKSLFKTLIRNAKWCQSLQCWRDFLSFDDKHLIPTHIFYPARFSKIINNDNEASRLILIMFIMMTLTILSRKCSMTTFIHIWYKFPAILLALSEAVIVF